MEGGGRTTCCPGMIDRNVRHCFGQRTAGATTRKGDFRWRRLRGMGETADGWQTNASEVLRGARAHLLIPASWKG